MKEAVIPARDRLRALQDEIIAIADAREYPEHIAFSWRLGSRITLHDLRHLVYPEHEATFREILQELRS